VSRILLVNPPFYRFLGSHYNGNNLGIAYIASVLNQNNHTAYVYNADFMDIYEYKRLKDIFETFNDYKKYFDNPNEYPIWDDVVNKILEFNPDWIGYTSYTANVKTIDILSAKVRQKAPEIRQVVGGPHATLDQGLLSRLANIDYTVSREGEYVMLDLVNGKDLKSIKGLSFRDEDGFIHNSGDSDALNIDTIPLPERDKLWGVSLEQKKMVDVSYVITIRGCPASCLYCSSPFHWKRNATRLRSPENVIEELKLIKQNYWYDKQYDYSASGNVGHKNKLIIKDNTIVYFVDDVFSINKKRVKKLLRMMIDNNLNMPFKCEIRADQLDEEICELLHAANCHRAKVGFESGSNKILKQIKKGETREQMMHGASLLKKANVPFTAYFMTGFQNETNEDLKQTIDFAKKIEADYYSLSILAPYYGTGMYFDLIKQGYKLDKEPWEYFYHQSGKLMINSNLDENLIKEYLQLNETINGKGYI